MRDSLSEPGSVFLLKKRFHPINETGIPQVYYDSCMNAITVKPGEPMYHEMKERFKLSEYFVSADFWEAHRKIERMREQWGKSGKPIRLAVRNDAPGIGDMIMATVIPKAFKEAFDQDVIITFFTNKELESLLDGNSYVDKISTNIKEFEETPYDLKLDLNTLEFKCDPRPHEVGMIHKKNRTQIYLKELGMWLVNKTPIYVVTEEERKWAKTVVNKLKRPLIGIEMKSAWPSRTYRHMDKVIELLKEDNYNVVVLDEKLDGKYRWKIRQTAAVLNECDVVVTPDSALLHIAGALRKRIVGLFGHTDGEVFAEDYEKATVLQGLCQRRKGLGPCWWEIDCVEGTSPKEKGMKGYVQCLSDISPLSVVRAIEGHLREPERILIVMLTYNNLSMTQKAIESIRSWHDYDLFVVDNASDDGTQKWLKEKGIEFAEKRCSVAEAQNIGIRKFRSGDWNYLLFLNNDIVLREDYIDELIDAQKRTGAYGITGRVMENIPPWEVDDTQIDKGDEGEVTDIPAGSYSATLFSRECIGKIGEFDEQFTPRYIEDNDYTLRIRLKGGKFILTSSAQYYHVLGAVVRSIETEKRAHDENWNRNIAKFQTKWGIHPHSLQSFDKLGIEWHDVVRGEKPVEAIGKIIANKRRCKVLLKRDMGGYGDVLFTSVIARGLKKRFGDKVFVYYGLQPEYVSVLQNYPYIEGVSTIDRMFEGFDFEGNLTDAEFRSELQEMQKFGEIVRPRTQIYLDIFGLEGSLRPDYFPTEEELKWGEGLWKCCQNKRVVVVLKASNQLKTWPYMVKLRERLEESGFKVLTLDHRKAGMEYIHSFRRAVALVATSNLVVAPDTAISNLAGALSIPVVTLFGNRNGKVFAKMFPSMHVVQGHCPIWEKGYCDFNTNCFGGAPHREKENIDIPECLKRLSVDEVWDEVRKLLLVLRRSDVPNPR